MRDLSLRVLKYCGENQLISKGDRIIAGVSGGADSVCLFYVLKELRQRLGFELFAVHVEHGIRGESSKRDEDFVRELCLREEIPLLVYNEDVPTYALANSLSTEEAARILRYADFEKARKELSADRIAVAHHLNDQAETLLFNLLRGSGLNGLSGMKPKRERIIRPLLFLKREEIEAFLRENGYDFATDETNADITYARNRIRNELIPAAEKISGEAVSHICRAGELISEAEAYIEKQAEELYTKCVIKRSSAASRAEKFYEVDIPRLLGSEHILRGYVIRRILTELYQGSKDLSSIHVETVLGLCEKQSGRRIELPKGVTALRVNDRLKIGHIIIGSFSFLEEEIQETPLVINGRTDVKEAAYNRGDIAVSFYCEVQDYEAGMGFPQKSYTKWFDYDKINSDLCVRTRRSGDRISLNGGAGGEISQSLKKFFTNTKVPVDERDRVLLVAAGSDIVWAVGHRIGERYKIDAETKRVLKIEVINNNNGGSEIE
ncbi:MAG: tRNA lysidine(34) synthetase TilS [Lachnospiraceae bacterium]|nr:tRNA lysidine(34) synthetase TilS [Lachnospiraceae bacterium]